MQMDGGCRELINHCVQFICLVGKSVKYLLHEFPSDRFCNFPHFFDTIYSYY